LLRYWYVFILMLIASLFIAFFFNKYSRRVYEVSTTVLVKDQSEKNLDPQDMLGFGFGLRNQNVQNELVFWHPVTWCTGLFPKLA